MFYVYLLVTQKRNILISYVGYTKNLKKRLNLHNISKGAKFTRGRKWKLIYKKRYKGKILAMREEYKLKKNIRLRKFIKKNYTSKCNI